MMIKPNYALPIGKEIVTAAQTIRLRKAKEDCFEAVDVHTGEANIYSFQEALELLRRPDVTLPLVHSPESEATAKIRTGGLFHRDQLSLRQQDELDFRKAFCRHSTEDKVRQSPSRKLTFMQLAAFRVCRMKKRKGYYTEKIQTPRYVQPAAAFLIEGSALTSKTVSSAVLGIITILEKA